MDSLTILVITAVVGTLNSVLLLVAVIVINVAVAKIKGELRVHTKQAENLNWVLVRGNRARESRMKTLKTTQAPPLEFKPNDRRRSG